MAISFDTSFGKTLGKNQASASADRPKAQFWINIGYEIEVPVTQDGADAGVETRFVSLPLGIPLDTQEHFPTNSKSESFAAFRGAQNNLLDQVMAAADKLAPGEEKLLNLQIQLRRVNADAEPIKPQDNPFAKALNL